MTSTITDRLNGVATSVAVKVPVRVATTAEIALSGLQIIDGIQLASGERALVKNQSNAIENGVYTVLAGGWVRTTDFDGTFDAVGGTQVYIDSGASQSRQYYRVSGTGPVVIGVDAVSFSIIANPPNSTYDSLATLKAAEAADLSYNLVAGSAVDGIFFFETANAPYTADDVNVIKLDSTALSVGALVRQKASSIQTQDGIDVGSAISARPQMQRVIQKLRRGEDCAISFAADSTSDATDEWVYLVAAAIAADYPAHTVEYRPWDDGASNYGAITTIQTGTAGGSAPTLRIYNASIPGEVSSRFAGNQLDAALRPAVIGGDPDLVVFSYGHNGLYDQVTQFASLAGLVGEASRAMPFTPIVIVGQNPVATDETMAAKVEVFRSLTAMQHLGWLDVHQSFKEYDGTLTDLYVPADIVHPGPLGSARWRDVFMSAFKFDLNGISGTGLSNFNHGILLAQQSYSDLSDWTATGLAVSEEIAIFETATASAKLVGDGVTSSAYISKIVIPSDSIIAYRNRHVSLTVRVYVGNGLGGNAGRIALFDGTDTTISPNGGPQGDGFFNATVTHFVNNGAIGLTAYIYINNIAATSETIYVDRVTVADGPLPRDAGTRTVNSDPLIQSQGSFSPTLFASGTDFDAVTYSGIRAGKWMLTGNIIHIQIIMRSDSITLGSAAGQVSIGGLPVAAAGGLSGYASLPITFAGGFAGDVPISGMISPGGSAIALYYRTASNAGDTALDPADLALGAASNTMVLSGSYQVA